MANVLLFILHFSLATGHPSKSVVVATLRQDYDCTQYAPIDVLLNLTCNPNRIESFEYVNSISSRDFEIQLSDLAQTLTLFDFLPSWRCQQISRQWLYLLCQLTHRRQDSVCSRCIPIFTDRNILTLLLSILTSTGGIGHSRILFREVGRGTMGPTEQATSLF